MKIVFSFEIDEAIQKKLDNITKYTDLIELKADEVECILGMEFIGIKLIIQNQVDGYEDFLIPQEPSYKKKFTQKNPIFGNVSYLGYLTLELLFRQSSYDKSISSEDPSIIKEVLKKELFEAKKVFQKLERKIGVIDENEFFILVEESLS